MGEKKAKAFFLFTKDVKSLLRSFNYDKSFRTIYTDKSLDDLEQLIWTLIRQASITYGPEGKNTSTM